jgi:hypothetical protein
MNQGCVSKSITLQIINPKKFNHKPQDYQNKKRFSPREVRARKIT